MKTKEISGNVTNIILEEEAVCLEFSESYPYCWIKNRSDGDVLIALDKEPVKGADGTYLAESGSNVRIPCGFGHKPVLFGSGEVQAIASVIAECPFKSKAKGGGLSVLEYIDIVSAGLTTYEGYDDGSLTMIADNNTWQTLRFKNGSTVSVLTGELTLTREEGLVAHSVRFQTEVSGGSGLAVTATALDDIPSSFVFPTRHKGNRNSGWSNNNEYEGKHKCTLTKAFTEIPASIADKWVTGKTFVIEYPPVIPMSFKESFTLTNIPENVTGVYCVLDNGSKDFCLMLDGCFPVFDYTNNRVDFGRENWGKYVNLDDYFRRSGYGNMEMSFSSASNGVQQYYNNLSTRLELEDIYFNTEDILDENGDIVVPKNCELSDFID